MIPQERVREARRTPEEILHNFAVTYRVESKDTRKEDISQALKDLEEYYTLTDDELRKELNKECQVRWKERGINVVCGHPLPCPKHTNREQWIGDLIKALQGRVPRGLSVEEILRLIPSETGYLADYMPECNDDTDDG